MRILFFSLCYVKYIDQDNVILCVKSDHVVTHLSVLLHLYRARCNISVSRQLYSLEYILPLPLTSVTQIEYHVPHCLTPITPFDSTGK